MRNHKIDTTKLELLPVPEGYKIRLYHADPDELKNMAKSGLPPPKYATTAELVDKDGITVAMGAAYCSDKDVPNRKLGNIIAHNRCIKAFRKQNNA